MTQAQIDLIEEIDLLIKKEVNQLLYDMDYLSTIKCFDTKLKLTNAFNHFIVEYNKAIKFPGRSSRAKRPSDGITRPCNRRHCLGQLERIGEGTTPGSNGTYRCSYCWNLTDAELEAKNAIRS